MTPFDALDGDAELARSLDEAFFSTADWMRNRAEA